jgi:hypothetical protein
MQRGAGSEARRFQQSYNFIFTVYTYEMKRHISSATLEAERGPAADNVQVTASDMIEAIHKVKQADACHSLDTFLNSTTDNTSKDKAIKKLISRLVPYSSQLKGTPMHILAEKNKLLAMISSPVVHSQGTWRWFVTFSPPDLYESRLFEILQNIWGEDAEGVYSGCEPNSDDE